MRPREHDRRIPRDLETIVLKAIAKEPADRFADAGAMAAELGRFLEGPPIRSRPVSLGERIWRWSRRNPGLAAAISLAALTLVAAVILSLLYAREQRGLAAARKLYAAEQAHRADDQAAGAASYKAALTESNRRLAMLDLERGRLAFEKGQLGVGMLWTVESLRMAATAGDEAGRHVALANLSAWCRHLVEPKAVFSHGYIVGSVAFSPDGKTFVTGCHDGNMARLWDVATSQPIGTPLLHPGSVSSIAFSPDGGTLLTGCTEGQMAQLWEAATGKPIGPPLLHSGPVYSVAFSPDGKTILIGGTYSENLFLEATLTGGFSRTVRLWEVATGKPIDLPLLHPGPVMSVAFSPNGKTFLTGGTDHTARQWDSHTGRPIGQPLAHSDIVTAVTFSPDGRTILTGSSDKTARLWDAATGRPIGQPLEHPDQVGSVAFSPDGKTILTGSADNAARLWDTVTGRPIGRPMLHASSSSRWLRAAFSPDGRFVLTNDLRTVRLWDVPAPLPKDLPRLAAWVETATGLELDQRGSIHVLDRAVWLERRSRLEQLGGPPPPDPASRLDPILFGADPTARGDAWKQRGHWDRAEEAYAEAIRARPLDRSVWDALARLHAERGQLDRAAATLADAVRRMPEDTGLRRRWGLVLLESGDRSGWQGATAALLDRLGSTINPRTASDVAWVCASGPDATGDPDRPLRLAEAAAEGAEERLKADALRTLGAARVPRRPVRRGDPTAGGCDSGPGWRGWSR